MQTERQKEDEFRMADCRKKQKNKFKVKLYTSRLVTCFCWRTPPRVQPSLVPDASISAPRRNRLSSQTQPFLVPDTTVSRPRRGHVWAYVCQQA